MLFQLHTKIGYRKSSVLLCSIAIVAMCGCNKLVTVPEPISSVTAGQVFSSDATATSAILGIYSNMNQSASFVNSYTTIYTGLSADELTDKTTGNESGDLFLSNQLTALSVSNQQLLPIFWQPAYFDIYSANAAIEGFQTSTGMSQSVKNELIGEAKFIRAFCYFYLTNLFGDLPLVLTSDFNKTVLLTKTPRAQIYQQIVADLIDAQNSLPIDFSLFGGQPIRPSKWAATALLARVYLYLSQPNYAGADSAANAVINSGQFSLVPLQVIPTPNSVADSDAFAANSKESIFQLQTLNQYPYATWEGNLLNPSYGTATYWMTSQLLAAFEPGDLRRINWVDSTSDNNGGYFYYPYKYQVQVGSGFPATENYTLLRYAELFLIRAEAEANLGQLGPAINDLNTIRIRAGLGSLSQSLSQSQILKALQQENRIEFFAEWGHRWLDLKRWGVAFQTLDTIPYKRGNIDSTQLLYPVPMTEIQTDPNLTQNPGY